MERRRKWIVNQLPVVILAFEFHAQNMQVALAHVADGDDTFGTRTRRNAAEAGGPGDRNLAAGRVAADRDTGRAGRIVAEDGYGSRLRAEAFRLEAEGERQRIARANLDRVGQHLR